MAPALDLRHPGLGLQPLSDHQATLPFGGLLLLVLLFVELLKVLCGDISPRDRHGDMDL